MKVTKIEISKIFEGQVYTNLKGLRVSEGKVDFKKVKNVWTRKLQRKKKIQENGFKLSRK